MSIFRFKQFEIHQFNTAMKVNTDGVLLGAWVEKNNPKKILDIGTGTGVIAIMMAQKFHESKIIAIEIDDDAAKDAIFNVENCKWKNRISVLHSDFINFAQKTTEKFDLIVSNPPYFENQLKAQNSKRTLARHTSALPFEKLAQNISKILSEAGCFSVVLPYENHENFIHLCSKFKLFCSRKTLIYPKENKKSNRVMLDFTKQINKTTENKIYIRKNVNYSSEYLEMTKNFYLFA